MMYQIIVILCVVFMIIQTSLALYTNSQLKDKLSIKEEEDKNQKNTVLASNVASGVTLSLAVIMGGLLAFSPDLRNSAAAGIENTKRVAAEAASAAASKISTLSANVRGAAKAA
jgi:hypothetical protein